MDESGERRHPWRSVVLALAAAMLAMLLVAACGGDDDDSGQEAADTGGETQDVVIGHVNPHLVNPILQALDLGQQKAAEALGWELRTQDADLSPDRQVSEIDNLITLDVNGITTWTLDPGATEAAYERASESDIPLVGFNSESPFINTIVRTELSTSCEPFQAEAQYIAERVENARTIVLGPPPVPALRERLRCFKEAAEENGLEIVGEANNMEDSAERGQQLAEELLTRHDDVQAIWAYNDPTALGAATAVDNAGDAIWSGNTEGVIVIGNNADPEAVEAIRNGILTMTYDENTFEAGVEAIKAFVPVLRDGEPVSAMPSEVMVPADPIDLENVDTWVPPEEREVDVD